ncbi:hypothetical protein F4821DRAFT_275078 [Hypoxylon rubiginosum]|uniref:Uncharacterized protein n=1 Tax=Hypoxylon rubiginosum TaxID=110542 RepID=A0ACC0DCE9_9PEZI|nr:hypothetical protein F4821DRAFT_275078 [Hypoxylon rubiginosum]
MSFPKNKDRLYIVLYLNDGSPSMPQKEDKYHWALAVGPKYEPLPETEGTLFHATINEYDYWEYEEETIQAKPSSNMLVRVVVGRVADMDRLKSLIRQVPVPMHPEDPNWNCVIWVKEALEAVIDDGKALSTSVDSWDKARDEVMWYVEEKMDKRGQVSGVKQKVSTWDMLDGKELIP